MNGKWKLERSSGYLGYRCTECASWVYANDLLICSCMSEDEAKNLQFEFCVNNPRYSGLIKVLKTFLGKGFSEGVIFTFIDNLSKDGFVFSNSFMYNVKSENYALAIEEIERLKGK